MIFSPYTSMAEDYAMGRNLSFPPYTYTETIGTIHVMNTLAKPRTLILLGLIVSLIGILLLASSCTGTKNRANSAKNMQAPATTMPTTAYATDSSRSNPPSPQATVTSQEIWVISDPHHLASSLREENETFAKFVSDGDGRLLTYSQEVLDALLWEITLSRPATLIVSGDLTTNGAKASHQELAEYFYQIEATGTQVLVVPGNHDINNPHALSFVGKKRTLVESITPEEFATIYKDFGYAESLYQDPNSLSYVAKLQEGLYAIMLDSNMYDHNYLLRVPISGGRLKPETLEWLAELQLFFAGLSFPLPELTSPSAGSQPHTAKDSPHSAKSPAGAKSSSEAKPSADASKNTAISVGHHNLVTHSSMFSLGFDMDNKEDAITRLIELGVKVHLSGHVHIQDIAYDAELDFYDIATGATIQHEQGYGKITVEDGLFTYTAKAIDVEGYSRAAGLTDPALLDFSTYASQYFAEQSTRMVHRLPETDFTSAELRAIQELFAQINLHHFAGTDGASLQAAVQELPGYQLVTGMESGFLPSYVHSILQEERDDRYLQVEL